MHLKLNICQIKRHGYPIKMTDDGLYTTLHTLINIMILNRHVFTKLYRCLKKFSQKKVKVFFINFDFFLRLVYGKIRLKTCVDYLRSSNTCVCKYYYFFSLLIYERRSVNLGQYQGQIIY